MRLIQTPPERVKYGSIVAALMVYAGLSLGNGGGLFLSIGSLILIGMMAAMLFPRTNSRPRPGGEG